MSGPRLARALLDRLIDPRLRDAVAGDLEEIFASEQAAHPVRARVAYWTRAIGLVLRLGPHARRTARRAPRGRGDGGMAMVSADLRYGARLFIKQPAFALAAVVTLGLAIGANTLIFTMANVLVLKPLPLREPERLGWIFATGPDVISWRGPISLPEYASYRDGITGYASLSAYQRRPLTMHADAAAERVLAQVVIGDLHGLWGVGAIGVAVDARRRTSAGTASRGAQPSILDHPIRRRTWRHRSHDAFRRGVRTVVGVLAPDIELGNISEIDVWLPYQNDPARAARTDRSWRGVGRLAEGATLESVDAEVRTRAARLAAEHPDTDRERLARVGSTRDALGTPDTWLVLAMLITVVGLLLLLACANIMNLLIARLIARRGELAVRTALGATRGRVLRQIVAEGLLLGVAGGVLGLAIAAGGLQAVRAVAYEPFFRQLAFDVRVIGFAVALAFVAPIVFSVIPARRLLRADAAAALTDATVRTVGNRSTIRRQSALVVLQVTLAVTLLVVGTLIVRSMQALTRVDPGYAISGLLSTQIEIPAWSVADDGDALRVRQRLVQAAAAIPGVEAVTTASELPALQPMTMVPFAAGDRLEGNEASRAGLTVASPHYFGVLGIPIVRGRAFTVQDAASPAPVVVVSRAMARRFWGDESRALGAQIIVEPASAIARAPSTVVGVAADVANAGFGQAPRPQLYVLDAHRPTRSFHLIVRAHEARTLAPPLRAAVSRVDPDLPTYQLRTVEEAFKDEASSNLVLSGLFAAFAIVALLLAASGLYGVMSYAVSQRSPELAIRIALGASPRSVAWSVLGRSLSLAGMGAALGTAGAFGLAHAMRSTLYGVGPADPATYLSALAITGAAALAASWIPMRRAARVDPITGLRQM